MKSIMKDLLLVMLQNRIGASKSQADMMTTNLLVYGSKKGIKNHGEKVLGVVAESLLNAYDTACSFYFKNKIDKELFDEINNPSIFQISEQSPFKELIKNNHYPSIKKWIKTHKKEK